MTGTSRCRLCLATDSLNPSGVGLHLMTLARALAADHDVTVAAPRGSELLARAAALGLAIKWVNTFDEPAIARWMRHAAFDLVHVHAGIGWEAHALTRAAHAAGAAVVRTEHLPWLITDSTQHGEHAAAMAGVDRLIGVGQAVTASYRDAGVDPAKLVTIPNGVEARAARRGRAAWRAELGLADRPVLLMVGRLEPQKAHAATLAAMPGVLARHPGTTLLIAGDGPLMGETARAIARAGLAGSVRLLGRVADVGGLMDAADLLVSSSLFEGLPLVLLEAFAAGLPVVATDAPGQAELIANGRTGWLSPASALAEAMADALDDADARATVADAARKAWHGRYRARRMIDDTTALYHELLQERQRDQRMTATRIGFIGAGGIAHRHLGVLEQFEDVQVVAVADADRGRAEEAAARVGGRAFDGADAMLDATELDAVFICVPPFAHGAPERAAIARDLPFFVEKPVALDLDVAEAIAEEVARRGLVTAVGYHWRYLDTVDQVQALLRETPARLVSGYWLDGTPPPRWWWKQDQSGGQMLEQTTHLIDLARYLLGPVTRAYGLANHTERDAFPGLDVATVSTASLHFASGAVGNFASTCLLNWNHRVGLHLFGEGLAVELTDHDVMIDTGQGRPVTPNGSDPVWREDRDFIDAVQGKANMIRCPYPEALETLRLGLAIGESARTGQSVTLTTHKEAALV